jgi:hypothetical protein
MKNQTLAKWGIIHAFGVLVYVSLIATFMSNGSKWFGEADQAIVTPIAALLLFVFSALVTSGLVLGKPIMLYLDGHKKEAVKLLFFTGMGLFIFLLLAFFALLLMK